MNSNECTGTVLKSFPYNHLIIKLNICNIPLLESEEYDIWLILSMYSLLRVSLYVKGIVVFLGFDCNNSWMFSCSRNAQVPFVEKSQLRVIRFQYYKHTWSDKAFEGTFVNRLLPSLYGGSLGCGFHQGGGGLFTPIANICVSINHCTMLC